MAAWTVRVRVNGQVDRQRFDGSRDAWDAFGAAVREHEEAPQLEATHSLFRRYEPVQQVAARVELAGPHGLRCGVDVRGDGSSEAWIGRVRKRLVEPEGRETTVQALLRDLGDG
jgi:hypothetical protein